MTLNHKQQWRCPKCGHENSGLGEQSEKCEKCTSKVKWICAACEHENMELCEKCVCVKCTNDIKVSRWKCTDPGCGPIYELERDECPASGGTGRVPMTDKVVKLVKIFENPNAFEIIRRLSREGKPVPRVEIASWFTCAEPEIRRLTAML